MSKVKKQVFDLYMDGLEPKEIAHQVYPDASQATVYRWINDIRNEDFDVDVDDSGQESFLNGEE